jgi:hypothetical protein
MYAYRHAPRATFAALHPRDAAEIAHMKYDLRHSKAPRLTALGAALIAMPIGFLIGKVLSDRKNVRIAAESRRSLYTARHVVHDGDSTEGVSEMDPAIH